MCCDQNLTLPDLAGLTFQPRLPVSVTPCLSGETPTAFSRILFLRLMRRFAAIPSVGRKKAQDSRNNRGLRFPAFPISRTGAVAPLLEEGRDLLAGDHLLEGLAGVDQLEGAAFDQHLGGHPAGVVAARHRVAVGAGAEEADELALAHLLQRTVLGEAITALADGADDVGDQRGTGGVAMQRHDLVVTVVHRRPHEVVHRGIDNEEIFPGAALEVLDARQKHTGVADHEASVLEEDGVCF